MPLTLSLTEYKILDADFASKDIASLSDRPSADGLGANALKERFDAGAKLVIAPKINALIDELDSNGGIIGVDDNGSLVPLQALLNELVHFATSDAKYIRINNDNQLETSADGVTWEATGSSGHVIIDANGTELPQRSRLKFVNSTAQDVDGVTVVNGIKGDTGEQGPQGIRGPQGEPAVVNGKSPDADGVITLTASDVGALPLDGSVAMSGAYLGLYNHYVGIYGNENQARIMTRNVADDNTNRRQVGLENSDMTDLKYALKLIDTINSATKTYNIFGEHNKPSGTYTGNGSATSRTIDTGGIGNAIAITGSDGGTLAIVMKNGAIVRPTGGELTYLSPSEALIYSGRVTLNTTNSALNKSDITYTYQVL